MRVIVVGAGAVGSFVGWAVAAGGGSTTVVRRSTAAPGGIERLAAVRPDGVRTTVEVEVVPAVPAVPAIPAGPAGGFAGSVDAPDLVIVAVKQYDLAAAVDSLAHRPAVPVLTVQNGVGAEEAALAARPAAPLLAGSLTASVERRADGSLGWLRTGGLGLAPVQGNVLDVTAALARTLRAAGVPVAILESAPAMKWSKLVGNLVGNATSGLLDLDPAEIYADPRLFEVERRQLLEALAVMRAMGLRPIRLPGANMPLLARALRLPTLLARAALRRVVGGARGGKDPSLRAAVDGGGRTEVGWLNGAVVRAGRDNGIATPVNAALTALVEEAAGDRDRRAWFRGRPDRLLEALGDPPARGEGP